MQHCPPRCVSLSLWLSPHRPCRRGQVRRLRRGGGRGRAARRRARHAGRVLLAARRVAAEDGAERLDLRRGDDHDDLETYKDSRSRSYVHRPFAFLFSCWCRRTTAWWWRPRRAARACAGGGTGNVRERGYHVLLSYSLLNTRTPTRHDTAHSHAHALALKRDTAKQAGGAFPSAAGGVQPKHCLLKDVV